MVLKAIQNEHIYFLQYVFKNNNAANSLATFVASSAVTVWRICNTCFIYIVNRTRTAVETERGPVKRMGDRMQSLC